MSINVTPMIGIEFRDVGVDIDVSLNVDEAKDLYVKLYTFLTKEGAISSSTVVNNVTYVLKEQ